MWLGVLASRFMMADAWIVTPIHSSIPPTNPHCIDEVWIAGLHNVNFQAEFKGIASRVIPHRNHYDFGVVTTTLRSDSLTTTMHGADELHDFWWIAKRPVNDECMYIFVTMYAGNFFFLFA
jgi:hypothetical protein